MSEEETKTSTNGIAETTDPEGVSKSVSYKNETEEEREKRLEKQREIDSRSIYVGNVDFKSTPEQLENFFNVVGVIERVTILYDKYTGLPKGYAYIEFETKESVEKAINDFHEKEFRGRDLNVTTKRTNLPRMSNSRGRFRGRGRGRGRGGRGRGNFRGRGGKSDNETEKSSSEV